MTHLLFVLAALGAVPDEPPRQPAYDLTKTLPHCESRNLILQTVIGIAMRQIRAEEDLPSGCEFSRVAAIESKLLEYWPPHHEFYGIVSFTDAEGDTRYTFFVREVEGNE